MARAPRSCVYCGASDARSADHVPPKAAFPKPRPSDLVTVPSCIKCNSSFKLDDEYFGAMLGLRTRVSASALGRQLVEKVIRGIQRPEADAMREMISADWMCAEDLPNEYDRVEGNYAYWLHAPRVRATAERIVRGLHYHRYRERLTEQCLVRAFLLEELSFDERALMLAPLWTAKSVSLGNGAFAYRTHHATEDICMSVWLLTFYADASYVVVTSPPQQRASA